MTRPVDTSRTAVRVVDVYAYRTGEEGTEHLLLRRAGDRQYARQWRMVGGKIAEGEAAWEAALRELHEETAQRPARFWSIPSINTFYEWQHDRVNLIPAFAAELHADPELDDEHDQFAWLPVDEAARHLKWPEQERLLRLTDAMLRDGIPPELVIPNSHWE